VLAAVLVVAVAAIVALSGDDTPKRNRLGAIASRVGTVNGGPVRLDILELSRDGKTATLSLRLVYSRNAGDRVQVGDSFGDGATDDGESFSESSLDGISLLDTEKGKRYRVFRDESGRCVCDRELSDVYVAPGQPVLMSATFDAPPEDLKDIDVLVPRFGAFRDIPIE